MTLRILNLTRCAIDASETRCFECDFQHPEHSHCILFGLPLKQEWVPATVEHGSQLNHVRLEVCRQIEIEPVGPIVDSGAPQGDTVLSITTQEQADAVGHGDTFREVKDQS
jgi:hypothetical protein